MFVNIEIFKKRFKKTFTRPRPPFTKISEEVARRMVATENSPAKQKSETFNDVIITAEQSNYKFSGTDKFVICFSFEDIIKLTQFGLTDRLSNRISQVLLIYFLMMLCFFTSVIKVYDINITIKKYIGSPLF